MSRLINLLLHDVYERQPGESGFPGAAADRYKLCLPDLHSHFRAMSNVRREPPVLVKSLATPANGKSIPYTISVDDGGISFYALLADLLEARGWRAHCLVTTSMIGRRGFLSRDQIRDLHRRGHIIGSHTHTHPQWFHNCRWHTQLEEWQRSKCILEDITGARVTVGSVPGGYFSEQVARAASKAGLEVLFTSEPQLAIRRIAACNVLGRYTLRQDTSVAFTRAIVSGRKLALFREWAEWNAKKVLKKSLGPRYEVLSSLIHRETS